MRIKARFSAVQQTTAALLCAGLLLGSHVSAFAATTPLGPYTVQPLDSAYSISVQAHVGLQSFERVNHLNGDSILYPGEVVAIPFLYLVDPGDTLWYIARRYNTSVASIQELNGLTSDLIYPGQKLLIALGSNEATTWNSNDTSNSNLAMTTTTASTLSDSQTASVNDSASAATSSTPTSSSPAPAPQTQNQSSAQTYNMLATSYDASVADNGPWGAVNYFGQPLQFGDVAVDPSVIPLGSTLFISGYSDPALPPGGFYATANDIGGAIQGNRIDIFLPSASLADQFGMENVKVQVISK
ncbi:LysM peptidoglycan-binding domain-containing protein [Sulfoacidibacillus thermotolerans]|uniref:LysM domain-containing protein n=1 Tax=Sulfoacidibacillus thermotolerans TaxID=1765684 RepID=A0A2U3DCC1_SULT2|nr:LysM peptidoglycan-binding domain-containing protein [Sulfoacidibacillus thermotolerans]PWI58931.1 hypothetical protein BM613_02315 [Sulfoacidibacillus thermotolerans]